MVNSFFTGKEYTSQDWANYFKSFITTGVFMQDATSLQPYKSGGRNIVITKGSAFIDGYYYPQEADITLDIPVNSSSSRMYHYFIVEVNLNVNDILVYVHSTTSSSYQRVFNESIKQLVLGVAIVQPNTSDIDSYEDFRTYDEYCGVVTGVVDQISFEELYRQHEEDFMIWFNEMKDQLSTDQAGHLQLEIDATNVNLDALKQDVDTFESQNHNFTGDNNFSSLKYNNQWVVTQQTQTIPKNCPVLYGNANNIEHSCTYWCATGLTTNFPFAYGMLMTFASTGGTHETTQLAIENGNRIAVRRLSGNWRII